ncbi:MAG: eukaryotic-like serine/threonine-protein kinase [Verrucomicrobiota bacterium]
MPDQRAERVAELVKCALEYGPEERASFLDEECGSDPLMRADIDSLLREDERAVQFLEMPALHLAAKSFVHEGAFHAGEIIGGYEIVSLIGAGGMGEVYLAKDIQLRRKVALKLVRAAMRTEEIVTRFRHEETILASLNDPNIAHLYGGGVTTNGIPFFVMEYVEGVRIDQYCDRHSLSIAARLQLFRKVCSAVQYAHQHLVIHRDLKPSNILVTEAGEPKLLDFGIAKLLNADESAPAVTLVGVMTPEYASPEQVRGDAITTASDVYSLGVVLYALLTGQSPYRTRANRPDEIARAITDQDPERPSTAAARTQTSSFEIRTSKFLKGDLDRIALMALRKEPSRRYTSAGQFSEDVRRYLDGLPVIASKDTFSYRASKFVRRNRIAVTAALLVALAIIGGLVVALWEGRIASGQRDVAQHERLKAERISEFLQRMLSFSNQSFTSVSPVAQRKDVTVNTMLDQITPQVESELADQPEVRAQVLRTIGSAYASQGQYDLAEKNLRAALETQTQLYGEENAAVAATSVELGVLSMRQIKLDEATRLLEKAVEFYRKERQRNAGVAVNARLAQALDFLGTTKFFLGDSKAAISLLKEALQVASGAKLQGNERAILAAIKTDLGSCLLFSGDVERGETLLHESLAEFREISNQPRWELGATLVSLGMDALEKNKPDEAEKFLLESEDIYRKTLGDKNLYLAFNLDRQATALSLKGDFDVAEKKARESLAITRNLFPKDTAGWLGPLQRLGDSLADGGHYDEGIKVLRECETISQGQGESQVVFSSKVSLCKACWLGDDYNSAIETGSAAIELARKLHLETRPEFIYTLEYLAMSLARTGRVKEADPFAREALGRAEKDFPKGDFRMALAEGTLGECLIAQDRFSEGESLIVRSYEFLSSWKPHARTPLYERWRTLARKRIVDLYEKWQKPDLAARYRAVP